MHTVPDITDTENINWRSIVMKISGIGEADGDPVQDRISVDHRTVTAVRVTCKARALDEGVLNHWFISLILTDNKSHKMDMVQYLTSSSAKLEWTLNQDFRGNAPLSDIYFDYECISNSGVHSVAALYDFICSKGRHHYSYASPIAGCRYWV